MNHLFHAAIATAMLLSAFAATAATAATPKPVQGATSDVVGAGIENAARHAEMTQVLSRLKPVMQDAMQAQQTMQQQMEQEVVDINMVQVLAPEALTSHDGIRQSREILVKARDLEARRDRMSREHLKNVDSRVRAIVPTTAAWDEFWVGYNTTSAQQLQLLEQGASNQRAVIASIADIVDYMAPLVGQVTLSPERELVFEDDVAVTGFNERMKKFTDLVEEEQEIARQHQASRSSGRGAAVDAGMIEGAE
jgi:hypothetical protein